MELKRSRTMGVVDGRKKEEKLSEKNAELRKMIRRAKREAEKAIKVGTVCCCCHCCCCCCCRCCCCLGLNEGV